MRVVVYLEGSSDKLALSVLLQSLVERKLQEGIKIEFFETPNGDRKESLLTKVPIKAVNILLNDPSSVVIAIPDLYPKNKCFPHETYPELVQGLTADFKRALHQKTGITDIRLVQRFRIFCFKHDLEALLLASEESLKAYFGDRLNISWCTPVEDQNHNRPPKYVIEEIFRLHKHKYKGTVDAPLILSRVSYQLIAERCPQCFRPFVEYLENIQEL